MKKRNEILRPILAEEGKLELYDAGGIAKQLLHKIPFAYYDSRTLNSLKHGMNMTSIMPCKRHACLYKELCSSIQNELITIEKGSPCHLELKLCIQLAFDLESEYRTKENPPNLEEMVEFVVETVRVDRVSRLLAIESGFLLQHSSSGHRNVSVSYRYWKESRIRKNRATEKLLNR